MIRKYVSKYQIRVSYAYVSFDSQGYYVTYTDWLQDPWQLLTVSQFSVNAMQ